MNTFESGRQNQPSVEATAFALTVHFGWGFEIATRTAGRWHWELTPFFGAGLAEGDVTLPLVALVKVTKAYTTKPVVASVLITPLPTGSKLVVKFAMSMQIPTSPLTASTMILASDGGVDGIEVQSSV